MLSQAGPQGDGAGQFWSLVGDVCLGEMGGLFPAGRGCQCLYFISITLWLDAHLAMSLTLRVPLLQMGNTVAPLRSPSLVRERRASPLSDERNKVPALSSQESLHSSGGIMAFSQPRLSDERDRLPSMGSLQCDNGFHTPVPSFHFL